MIILTYDMVLGLIFLVNKKKIIAHVSGKNKK